MMTEIEHATDGALRVSRRQMYRAFKEARKAHERLELEENGDFTTQGVEWNVSTSFTAAMDSIKLIEKELDARDAHYKPRNKI